MSFEWHVFEWGALAPKLAGAVDDVAEVRGCEGESGSTLLRNREAKVWTAVETR
jgi:hypothetical protein